MGKKLPVKNKKTLPVKSKPALPPKPASSPQPTSIPKNTTLHQKQITEQRKPVTEAVQRAKLPRKPAALSGRQYIKTGIEGFDALIEKGIPKGASILVAGGAGSGKTIFCLQICNYHAVRGKKCLYMSFEENEEKLKEHMVDFGWNAAELEKKGLLIIQRLNPFDVTRAVDAWTKKLKGELLIKTKPILLPEGFNPDIVIVDSLTAIASAFSKKEESYRIYIEQLFRFFEGLKSTSFLITETDQIPTVYSPTGVEEFLADGVIVIYNIISGSVRENAIEILKIRGAKHQKKIVALQKIDGKGIEVYPEQEVFADIAKKEKVG